MKSVAKKIQIQLRDMTVERWLQMAAGSWCWMAAILLIWIDEPYDTIAFAQGISWPVIVGALLAGMLLLLVVDTLTAIRFEGYVLVTGVVTVLVLLAAKAGSGTRLYLYCALAVVVAAVMYYASSRRLLQLPRVRMRRWMVVIGVGALFCAAAAGIAIVGVSRYVTYHAPNFDFGIFVQMFHNMKETLLPMTTCERNELMSHFSVHISPIYYLLLPVYALFPSPLTLQIGQAVIVASGVIPMYLLARRLGGKTALVMAFVYAAYPALSCGCLYDLHENSFLAPLLLWMFYFYESGKLVPLFVAAALVLMVKEDAAEYIMLFAAYIMLSRRDYRRGALLLGMALIWFGVALWLLNTFGEGDMSSRYAALSDGGGLMGLLHTLAVNPGLFLKTLFLPLNADNEPYKRRYLIQLLVPLVTMLFSRRHFSRYILAVPVIVNLLSGWIYQTDLTFQYSFGVSAFLLYLCVLNLQDMPRRNRNAAVCYAAVSTLLLYLLLYTPSLRQNVAEMRTQAETSARITAALSVVPEDASVTTSTFFLPHLAQRAEVYEDFYHSETDTDYLVLDLRYGTKERHAETQEIYLAAGYTEVLCEEGLVLIMKSPTA